MLTRITNQKILCVYIHVYRITKNWGPGPYNYLPHAYNRRYYSDLSLTRNRSEAHKFYLAGEIEKFGHVLAEKKVILWWLMNSNMVKPEKFGHLHLVYHFKIPLRTSILKNICKRLLLEVFYNKAVLKNNIHRTKLASDKSSVKKIYQYVNLMWQLLTRKHMCWNLFLTLSIAKFFRAFILKNICKRLLLKMCL